MEEDQIEGHFITHSVDRTLQQAGRLVKGGKAQSLFLAHSVDTCVAQVVKERIRDCEHVKRLAENALHLLLWSVEHL